MQPHAGELYAEILNALKKILDLFQVKRNWRGSIDHSLFGPHNGHDDLFDYAYLSISAKEGDQIPSHLEEWATRLFQDLRNLAKPLVEAIFKEDDCLIEAVWIEDFLNNWATAVWPDSRKEGYTLQGKACEECDFKGLFPNEIEKYVSTRLIPFFISQFLAQHRISELPLRLEEFYGSSDACLLREKILSFAATFPAQGETCPRCKGAFKTFFGDFWINKKLEVIFRSKESP